MVNKYFHEHPINYGDTKKLKDIIPHMPGGNYFALSHNSTKTCLLSVFTRDGELVYDVTADIKDSQKYEPNTSGTETEEQKESRDLRYEKLITDSCNNEWNYANNPGEYDSSQQPLEVLTDSIDWF